ncbi:MAG TPA: DEAD/DEAH box helicase [Noviherbaspirillum sp.]|nr:DEAD/DEAH box helicase [Noviherbaspirillum sp.]
MTRQVQVRSPFVDKMADLQELVALPETWHVTGTNLAMNKSASRPSLQSCTFEERAILSLLALLSDPLGKTRLLEHIRHAGIQAGGKSYNASTLADTLAGLRKAQLVTEAQGIGFACAAPVQAQAIRAAFEDGTFEPLCQTIEALNPARLSYDGSLYLRDYHQAFARLRIVLLRGRAPEEVYPWLEACLRTFFRSEHPYVALFAKPFDQDLFERLHPMMQEEVMTYLLAHAISVPEGSDQLRNWTGHYLGSKESRTGVLVSALAEHWIACGMLDDAEALLGDHAGLAADILQPAILLLRGEHARAAEGFEAALKMMRKALGKRTALLPGLPGYLYVLAMMRSEDAGHKKLADTYLDQAQRHASPVDLRVYMRLHVLGQVQSGIMPEEAARKLDGMTDPDMLPQLFRALAHHWLGLRDTEASRKSLVQLFDRADSTGFHWVAAQAAEMLHRTGEPGYGERAAALRQRYGLSDLCDWFARQEPWQRQLSALMGLRQEGTAASKGGGEMRLAWMISYDPQHNWISVEPREQKRDARGNWTKGRAIALRRLREEADSLPFLAAQDARVLNAAVGASSSYYRGASYDLDAHKAIVALVGHPLVFWQDAPDIRVEVLRGEPELLVKTSGGKLHIDLQPPLDSQSDVLVRKETPTRLRVYGITDEHRRVAAILGNGLKVPAHAKDQVLQAVGAVSSLITVQSDIGGGPSDAEQVDADTRLHAHLMPHGDGLRMQVLVKPFADGGPFYPPGEGSESVIAEVGGRRLQAHRDLAAEREAERQLIVSCPVLDTVYQQHGEWMLDDAQTSLELLLQLQAAGNNMSIAWPEGERFRIGAHLGFEQLRLAVKSERDWFAASGELQVDEQTVIDLRKLLELVKQSRGRFVPLEGNRFLALTEEFHRRLSELAVFGESHAKGVRIHPLASFALEDLVNDTSAVKTDKQWQQHVARLRELDVFDPQLPGTLQADLRDYQLAGFRWLARLAHWGVGACLADDMGLGKTVQTLALLVSRAAQGPALVVAPTSVCPNWLDETARFAPTLQPLLFGAGDRRQALAELQPFDVVVVSYGLLQQEAELFAGVQWHTIVLDEAQAIKNAATKRSQAVMALSGNFRMAATGTPLENHLGELWNLFRFINPGLLGSLEQFNQRFATPIERDNDADARARLRRLIQPFMLRRTKTQVLTELPSRTEIVRQVELSKEEMALYESLRRDALQRLAEDDASAGQKSLKILAEIMRLRRACCNPKLVAPELGLASSKLAAFGKLLDELLENRHKALVFSQFVDHLGLIRTYLDERGVRYQYLDGATPMQERKRCVDAFQSGDGDVFLISLKAGGTGLNLTAADYVVHMDPWWNPAVEDQASDRAHRMGQQRPVTIYRLVVRHTIEEAIVDLHRHKRELADNLLEGGDAGGRMSPDEIMRLLQAEMQ